MKNLILIFSSKTGVGNGYNFFESQLIKDIKLPLLIGSSGIVKSVCDADIVIIGDSSYSDIKEDNSVKKIIEQIKDKEVKLYVIYHDKDNQNFGHDNHANDELAKFFYRQIEFELQQSHVPGSIYDTELKQIADSIDNKNADKYSNAIDAIIKRFPNPFLESFIHLYKSLKLLPLKIKNGDYSTVINEIKKKEGMKLAVEKFLPNGETVTPDTLEAKLTTIEDEIVKISTTKL